MPAIFGWFLNALYLLFLIAVSPVLVFRRISRGKYRRGWREKLTGQLTRQHPDQMCLWFHAVSVGEVLQLQKVLEEAESRFPSAERFVTVTTETGYDVAKSKYPRSTVSYFPLDFTWAVEQALTSVRPDLIVLVELELWPNLIFAAKRRKIPLVLVNGRMGENSFRGYSRLKPLMRRLLSCFEVLAVQNETYAERLKSLGAPEDRVVVTGNIKFDRVESDRNNAKTAEIRRGFRIGDNDLTLIAGSTQEPEEEYALDAWLALRAEFDRLRLILVPRHKERFDDVATLIQKRGCRVIRRSEPGSPSISADERNPATVPEVALLDTLGELAACWGVADIAFVGGSLTQRGGQNMIEPAGYGAAVLFGPNTWNFKDVTESLLTHQAARVINGPDELRETVRQLLQHPDERARLGQAARDFVASQSGATQRTMDLMAAVVKSRTLEQQDLQPPDSRASRRKSRWQFLKGLLFLIVAIFVGMRAVELWKSAPSVSIRIDARWLVLSSLFYFAGWLPCVWLWRAMSRSMNQPLDWWNALRAYYVGHLGKYVPGKGLVLVIRGSMTKEADINPFVAGFAAACETLVFMATGAAMAVAFFPLIDGWKLPIRLPGFLNRLQQMPFLAPVIVLIVFVSTAPVSAGLFTALGRKTLRLDGRAGDVPPSIPARLVICGVISSSMAWICHALSLGCVLQSVATVPFEMTNFPTWLVACSTSTVAGFAVLIAPGGLGIREGFLVEFLKGDPAIGPAVALVAAALLRAVWFGTELVAAGILFAVGPSIKKRDDIASEGSRDAAEL